MDLLPFWTGRGDLFPVFCLPHAGGGASAYRGLAKDLRPEVDLQPVQERLEVELLVPVVDAVLVLDAEHGPRRLRPDVEGMPLYETRSHASSERRAKTRPYSRTFSTTPAAA